jgi:hypothetical protein
LVGRVDALVIDLLRHALLVFRLQQGQQGRDLIGSGVIPDAPSLWSIEIGILSGVGDV